MTINQETTAKIYNALGDDLSRKTFLARLQFSACPCDDTLAGLVATLAPNFVNEVRSHIEAGRKIAVYGAGNTRWYSGRMVYQMFESHCCGLFDKNAVAIGDIPMQSFKFGGFSLDDADRVVTPKPQEMLIEYISNVAVIICVFNREFQLEIYNNLLLFGIKQENIMFISQLFDIFYRHEYFYQPFYVFGSDEVLIDCGCYDASDTINFIKITGGGGGVIAIEPSRKNLPVCRQNLKEYCNVELLNICVGEANGTTRFIESESGLGSRICNGKHAGSYQVDIRTIDSIANGKHITFIKMDIEGAELAALKGAENTIRRCKPKLAICLYHKHEDIVEIPAWLIDLDVGYKLYIRHQSFNMTETVLYAV